MHKHVTIEGRERDRNIEKVRGCRQFSTQEERENKGAKKTQLTSRRENTEEWNGLGARPESSLETVWEKGCMKDVGLVR